MAGGDFVHGSRLHPRTHRGVVDSITLRRKLNLAKAPHKYRIVSHFITLFSWQSETMTSHLALSNVQRRAYSNHLLPTVRSTAWGDLCCPAPRAALLLLFVFWLGSLPVCLFGCTKASGQTLSSVHHVDCILLSAKWIYLRCILHTRSVDTSWAVQVKCCVYNGGQRFTERATESQQTIRWQRTAECWKKVGTCIYN